MKYIVIVSVYSLLNNDNMSFEYSGIIHDNKKSAKKELAMHSIYPKIRKLTDVQGCNQVLEFNFSLKSSVTYILLRAQINFEEYKP